MVSATFREFHDTTWGSSENGVALVLTNSIDLGLSSRSSPRKAEEEAANDVNLLAKERLESSEQVGGMESSPR